MNGASKTAFNLIDDHTDITKNRFKRLKLNQLDRVNGLKMSRLPWLAQLWGGAIILTGPLDLFTDYVAIACCTLAMITRIILFVCLFF